MTDRTLREKIERLPRYKKVRGGMDYEDMMMVRPEGDWIKRADVLRILDAHPAPPAIADAPVSDRPSTDAMAEAAKVLLEALHSDQVQGAVDTMHGMLPVGTARGDAQIGATFFLDALAEGQQP